MRLVGRVMCCIGAVLILLSCLLVPSYAAAPSCGASAYWRAQFSLHYSGSFDDPIFQTLPNPLFLWYNNGDWVTGSGVIPPSGVAPTSQFYITDIPLSNDLKPYYVYDGVNMINTLSGVGPFVSYEYKVKFTSAVGYPSNWDDIPVLFYDSSGKRLRDVAMVTGYDTVNKEMTCVFYGGDGFSPAYVSVQLPDRYTNAPNDLYVTQSLSVVENNSVNMAMAAVYEQLGDINLKLDEGLANDDRLYDYLQDTLNGSANLDSSSLDEGQAAVDDLENLENQIDDAMGTADLDFDQIEDVWQEYDVDIAGYSSVGGYFSMVLAQIFKYFGILPFFALTLGLIMTVLGR